MSLTVTKDEARAVVENIRTFAGKGVLVGIPADRDGRKDGEPIGNAALGFIHENGSPVRGIPARPFLVPGVTESIPAALKVWRAFTVAGMKNPEAVDKGLEAVGLMTQAGVKKRIVSQEGFTPLAASTIAARQRKGYKGEKALIRTGQLMNSITYVIREGGNGGR